MNGLKTALLLGGLSGLLLFIGAAIGGQSGLLLAFVIATVMNIGSYWFSDKIVLRMYRASAVGPGHPLYEITARLAQRAGLPMPKVYVIPDSRRTRLPRAAIRSTRRSQRRKASCASCRSPSSKA
jgi:heat shock protein HtpX